MKKDFLLLAAVIFILTVCMIICFRVDDTSSDDVNLSDLFILSNNTILSNCSSWTIPGTCGYIIYDNSSGDICQTRDVYYINENGTFKELECWEEC